LDNLVTAVDDLAIGQQDLQTRTAEIESCAGDLVFRTTRLEKLIEAAVSRADLQVAIDAAIDPAIDAAVEKAVEKAVGPTWMRLKELEERVEDRFSGAERSVEVLRIMIADTDHLLERVLEGLDLLTESRLAGTQVHD
jgi:hypothetical protein